MLLVLSREPFCQRNFKGIDKNGRTEAPGKHIAAKLASVIDAKHSFFIATVDSRDSLFTSAFHRHIFLEIHRIKFDIAVHRRSAYVQRFLNFHNIRDQSFVLP